MLKLSPEISFETLIRKVLTWDGGYIRNCLDGITFWCKLVESQWVLITFMNTAGFTVS